MRNCVRADDSSLPSASWLAGSSATGGGRPPGFRAHCLLSYSATYRDEMGANRFTGGPSRLSRLFSIRESARRKPIPEDVEQYQSWCQLYNGRANVNDIPGLSRMLADSAQTESISSPRVVRVCNYDLHIDHLVALVEHTLAVLTGFEFHPIPLAFFTFCIAWLRARYSCSVYAATR